MSIEYLIPHKQTLKILCKSKHFSQRYMYKRKRECVFFSKHSVVQGQNHPAENLLGRQDILPENKCMKTYTQNARILRDICPKNV